MNACKDKKHILIYEEIKELSLFLSYELQYDLIYKVSILL